MRGEKFFDESYTGSGKGNRGIPSSDFYEILGVSRGATEKEIQSAYHRLARDTHPDFNPRDENKTERFRKFSEAYSVLSDAKKRKVYDSRGSSSVPAETRVENFRFGGFTARKVMTQSGERYWIEGQNSKILYDSIEDWGSIVVGSVGPWARYQLDSKTGRQMAGPFMRINKKADGKYYGWNEGRGETEL